MSDGHLQRTLGSISKQLDVAINVLDRARRWEGIPTDLKAEIVSAIIEMRRIEKHSETQALGSASRKPSS